MISNLVPPQADTQAGVFTFRQAVAAGATRHQCLYRARTGVWQRVAGIGYCLGGQPVGIWQACWAAILTWPDAVIWGPSALAAAFPQAPLPKTGQVTAAIPHHRKAQFALRGRKTKLTTREVTSRYGIQVESPMAALADTLSSLTKPEASPLFAWFVSRELIELEAFTDAVAARVGRRGSVALARFGTLAARGAAAESEALFQDLLIRASITGWKANAKVTLPGGGVVSADVWFDSERLACEVDGWASHSSREAFQSDRARHNLMAAAGIQVLHFTWDDITVRPNRTAQVIATALAERRNKQ